MFFPHGASSGQVSKREYKYPRVHTNIREYKYQRVQVSESTSIREYKFAYTPREKLVLI